ncbi:disease resistance RPP13-like protein 4 [Populus nigra]|uniref:disease resistance RPP13-like protein 4 n=1 Tax=Populus nigra TaxID=3691 RepID=UPI002B26F633|nr:disease resistance RPP13-like protein 4 [Populus nigra]
MALVDAMIQTLTEELFTALMNQAQYALDFKSQFERMKTQLELMKAFLNDTEILKTKKEVLKLTMIQIRELIYEADDLLTDCRIRDEYQKDGRCSNFSASMLLFLYRTGKKLKDINLRIEKLENSLRVYLTPQLFSIQENVHQVTGFSCQDYDPANKVGLEHDARKIKEWIISKAKVLHRIGMIGMGGLGKSTIAQKLFNDEDVRSFFKNMIWLSVSQDFSEEQIMKSMLKQLYEEKTNRSDKAQIMHKIHLLLEHMTCLIVMDDVWSIRIDWWNQLCSGLEKPTGKNSCIMITTRNEEVATNMGVEKSRIHRPSFLDDDESWSLFCKYAFYASKEICDDQQLENVGRDIVQKCGGLPLAIKTIAALLSQKRHSLVEWKHIYRGFHELTTRGQVSSVFACLQLSYNALPVHLKQLFLCFSIYPEDFEIPAEQLVLWWIGEGFIRGKDSKTAIELGYVYLTELVQRCLVEVVDQRGYDGKIYGCRMHDLVRDMTIVIAKDESFCSFEEGRQKLTSESRRLGFTSEMSTKSLKHCPKLRALLMMSSIQRLCCDDMESLSSLRVLDLSYFELATTAVQDLLKWIVSLKHLAYLNLSGVRGIGELPSSIKKLRNLQVFVLYGCTDLFMLHPFITHLKNMVVLDFRSCPLIYLPKGIGMLSQLQELSGFVMGRLSNEHCCHLLELQDLSQLRVLRMYLNAHSEIAENETEVLSKLKKLKVLELNAHYCKDHNTLMMLDDLYPPPSLQELYIGGYHCETLPAWINPEKLSNLRYISIQDSDINFFETSPQSVNGRLFTWNVEGLCFKKLQSLKLDWKNLEEDMPLLRNAEIAELEKQYQKDDHCFDFSPEKSLFFYRTGKKLKEISLQIEQMENSLRAV